VRFLQGQWHFLFHIAQYCCIAFTVHYVLVCVDCTLNCRCIWLYTILIHRQTLDRQTLDRQTLDRQTLDTTNPGHNKPWTGQTLDTTNPGQNRTGGMHTWQCKLRFCVHISRMFP
jgi:hypothetical protein